uniref:Uncharacterized protein n=1 Tax=Medicago truncatula TaxID=3880 RepID=I3T3U4_MEDTR|nr:unknown [Medicago truncatula]
MDSKCTHNHSCDWFWSAVFGMGYCTTWMDCWTINDASFLVCYLLHLHSSFCLLSYR